MYHNAFLRGFTEYGRSLGVNVAASPDASPTELQHALNFDLSCLTSFRGCRLICQLMPSIAQDYNPTAIRAGDAAARRHPEGK